MSDPVWYYAEGERQKGPVSAEELKRFVELGRVKPTDLVWQPGMDDWVAAKTIRGLVPEGMQSEASASSGSATIDGGFENDDAIFTRRRRRRSGPAFSFEILNQWGGRYARFCVLLGLLTVVVGRGCDSFGEKYAKRQQVLVELAKANTDKSYRQRRSEIQSRIDELQRKPVATALDQQSMVKFQEQLLKADREFAEQQSLLTRTTWLDLDNKSRSASSEHVAWQPFYELITVFGSIVLAYGLLCVAFTGEPIERWGCWILLGVLLASLFLWRSVL